MQQETGIVKWFSESKGYGFITKVSDEKEGKSAEGKKETDYFVHYSDIMREGFKTLLPGQKVKFKPKNSDKGPLAIEVEIIEE